MLDAAKNKVRVKISYIMIALTVAGCILMVIEGKKVRVDFLSICLFPQEAIRDGPSYLFCEKRRLLPTQEIIRHKVRYSKDKPSKPRISCLGINSKS